MAIKSVAIIGAGPGGLAAIYELTHTSSDGTSTVGGAKATDPFFTKVVAFEQKDLPGGIWAPTLDSSDLPVPPQELLDSGKYHKPDVIHPPQAVPEELHNYTFEEPYVTQGSRLANELEWKRSGVFADLFTNIPARFTRFSYLPNEKKYHDKSRVIYPFLSQTELVKRIANFVTEEQLADNIRVNSRVELVSKKGGKWIVTVRQRDEVSGEERWYQEQFDAVIIANGHYTVPNIPFFEGLAEYNKKHPGAVIHAKSYRDHHAFKDKKVLVVGTGIGTANLVQYVVPLAKETVISKRGPNLVFEWINDGLKSKGIISKPEIQKIDAAHNEVTFTDGSVERGFDKILLTTGYHYHLPFLQKYLEVISPSNLSRVGGLFHNTFAIEDPTLAAVGVTVSQLNFHTIEASAAAIAGVWSGLKRLPSKEEQRAWELLHLNETGDNLLFHYYSHSNVKEQNIDKLLEYAAKGRSNPLATDGEHVHEIDLGLENLEKLFYQLKDGHLDVKDTIYDS